MAKCSIYWLACCSFLYFWPLAGHKALAAEAQPVSAEFFLQSIEPDPGMHTLYDFLDIYASQFAACKETETYLRALHYVLANGDKSTVRQKLRVLEACPDLSAPARQSRAALLVRLGEKPAESDMGEKSGQAAVPPAVEQAGQEESAELAELAERVRLERVARQSPQADLFRPAPEAGASEGQLAKAANAAKPGMAPGKGKALREARAHVHRVPAPAVPTALSESRRPTTSAFWGAAALKSAPTGEQGAQAPAVALLSPATASAPASGRAYYTDLRSRAVYRSGDAGTSRLFRLENTVLLGWENWQASVTSVSLDSGQAREGTFAGSFFKEARQHNLLTHQTGFMPQIAYRDSRLEVAVGTTPLVGDVAALPTFRLAYRAFDKLHLALFQESVTDSLLSYVGLRDMYSDKGQGRVVKLGGRAAFDDTFAEHWFYGAAVTGAYLYGENVKENTAVKGEAHVGRTFGPFAVGLYSSVDHFATDLNHFTLGHGGYYSPWLAASSVLFASWEYVGKAGRIKAEVSSGYLFEQTLDSDHYYGTSTSGGRYRGETHERLAINAGLEGSLRLTDSLSLTSALRFINAANFNEGRGSVQLKWEF